MGRDGERGDCRGEERGGGGERGERGERGKRED